LQKKPFFKMIALYLVIATTVLTLPAQGWAMFIPSGETASVRQSDMSAIQKTLESSVIKQRLSDYGLSSEEALAKVNQLSQEQIHQLAANLDSLQAGADGVDALIFLLLVAIIVVIVLQVTGHKVIVK
jgi:Flp pilus assembly protein TadB